MLMLRRGDAHGLDTDFAPFEPQQAVRTLVVRPVGVLGLDFGLLEAKSHSRYGDGESLSVFGLRPDVVLVRRAHRFHDFAEAPTVHEDVRELCRSVVDPDTM